MHFGCAAVPAAKPLRNGVRTQDLRVAGPTPTPPATAESSPARAQPCDVPCPATPQTLQHASGRQTSQPLRVACRLQLPLASPNPLHARRATMSLPGAHALTTLPPVPGAQGVQDRKASCVLSTSPMPSRMSIAMPPAAPPMPPLLPGAMEWSCDNKPTYAGACGNYHGCWTEGHILWGASSIKHSFIDSRTTGIQCSINVAYTVVLDISIMIDNHELITTVYYC